jgi:hypothetical protein
MFRITEDPPSRSLVQCLAKNDKNYSMVSIDMDKVGVMAEQRVRTCCHNTDLVHVDGHDRIILVNF